MELFVMGALAAAKMGGMHIKGIHGISLIDYPGHISSVIFTGGCSFRCPFCQNPDLVMDHDLTPDVSIGEVLEYIDLRKNFIDGVVISGGEPTLSQGLPDFTARMKEMGLAVKVDTNGYHPANLEVLIQNKTVDFVAMDIKTSLARYPEAAGKLVDLAKLERSIDLLMGSGIEYEFRTTVVPGLVGPEEIECIASRIRGAKRYAIQQFATFNLLDQSLADLSPVDPDLLHLWAERARRYLDNVTVRGI